MNTSWSVEAVRLRKLGGVHYSSPGPSSQRALWCPLFEQGGRGLPLGSGAFVRQTPHCTGLPSLSKLLNHMQAMALEAVLTDAHFDGNLAGSQTLALKQRWCN